MALVLLGRLAGANALTAAAWVHWDANHYLAIALRGYEAPVLCAPELHYPPGAFCGHTAWFPGYPIVVRLVSQTGLAMAPASLAASALAQLGCLALLWDSLKGLPGRWPALFLGAFFFGSVYCAAPFPVSLCLLSLLACLRWCVSGRFLFASLAGALAGLSYPAAIFLLPAVLVWGALRREWRVALVAVGVAAGVAAALLIIHLEAGSWRAFLQVQANYRYSGNFFDALGAQLKPLVNPRYRNFQRVVTALQTLIVLGFMATLATHARRLSGDPRLLLLLLYAGTFWVAPLALGGALSLYRSESLLLPAVLLVPSLPRRTQMFFTAAALCLFAPMGVLFFKGLIT